MKKKRRTRHSRNDKEFYESFFFRFATKLLLSTVIVLVVLTMIQCTIKKPESPTWDTQLVVPLVNRTYQMDEIVRKIDQEGFVMDEDSNIVFKFDKEIDTISMNSSDLAIDDITVSPFSQQLGTVSVDPPGGDSSTANISEAFPGFNFSLAIPDTSFTITYTMDPLTDFSSAMFSTGLMDISIINNLGFDLDSVYVRLLDAGNGDALVDADTTGAIAYPSAETARLSLAGKSVSNTFKVEATCFTGGGGPFFQTSSLEITCALTFPSPLTITAATDVYIRDTSMNFVEAVPIQNGGETDIIHLADLNNGSLDLHLNNNTELDAILTITIPDLKQGGGYFSTVCNVPANLADSVLSFDISNYDLEPADISLPQELDIQVAASILSNGSPIDVQASDNLSVSAQLTNLSFNSVRGVFDNAETIVDEDPVDIDVPKGFDGIELQTVVLTLEIENDVEVAGYLDLQLNGSNGKTLTIADSIAAGTVDSAVTTVIINANAADFLNPVPDQIDVTGSVYYGNGVTVGTIRQNDYVFASVHVEAPMDMIINQTQIESDIESQSIEQDDIDIITNHTLEARFVYNITNHLPLGAYVSIYLGGDSASLFTDPQLLLDSLSVEAAPVDLITGIVNDTLSTGYQTITLDSVAIKILENDPLYIGHEIYMQGSDGVAVKLTNSDYISINGRIEVDYRFDGEF